MNGGGTIVPLSLRLRGIEFSLVNSLILSRIKFSLYLYYRILLSLRLS
jgi:hypothetical protein